MNLVCQSGAGTCQNGFHSVRDSWGDLPAVGLLSNWYAEFESQRVTFVCLLCPPDGGQQPARLPSVVVNPFCVEAVNFTGRFGWVTNQHEAMGNNVFRDAEHLS